jgi:NADPH:quinone reductase-like Zn-dependent oxidoreductase
MDSMRAIVQHEFGGPEVLEVESRPVPEPVATEVRVRVEAAGVNPVDWKTRGGKGAAVQFGLPLTVGWDVTGIVDAVGPGVTRFAVGDPVFGMPWFPRPAAATSRNARWTCCTRTGSRSACRRRRPLWPSRPRRRGACTPSA